MIRAALVLAALALVFAGWTGLQLRGARAELVEARARLAGYAEAERWRARELARVTAETKLDRELQEGVGSDAPLSDYLRHGAGRVWP